jgi:ubiquinone/menaquinone biosynthesis C-methylase UbiE
MSDIEKVISYWNKRPCNIFHSQKEIGTREYFDEIEARKYFVEPHIPKFAGFEKWKGKRVLEVGCGIGTDTINFARNGASITAVDISEKSLEIAKTRAEVFGVSNKITFYRCNAEKLWPTVPREGYDLVYSFGVIHHTPNPRKVIEEVLQYYTHRETILKVMVYHKHSLKALNMFMGFDNTTEAQEGCPVAYTYTRRSLKHFLKGFDIQQMDVEHIFPYVLSEYINYSYVKKWPYQIMPPSWFQWLEHRVGWHLCITAKKKDQL